MFQKLKMVFKKDISHLYVVAASQLFDIEANNEYSARFLEASEIKKISSNPLNNISATTAETVDNVNVFCCAVFEGETLAGYSFFAKGKIPATYNSGGKGFGGVGLDLPEDVLFMFKVYVFSEFRGRGLIALAARLAVKQLLSTGGWVVTTTDQANRSAQSMFRTLGFIKGPKISEYRVFGVGLYRMPSKQELFAQQDRAAATVGLFSG